MKAFQLKITIKNSKPPIWRRVIIPAGITFSQLSMILNKVMGWSGFGAFEFEFFYLKLHVLEDADDPYLFDYDTFDHLESSKAFIREYMEENDWFTYTYHSVDEWNHRVDIEKVIKDYEFDYPQVIKYKGDCPAEEDDFAISYDMQAVNQELKEQFFYRWGKAEKRFQAALYEEHSEGKYGLRATKRDKNKEGMIVRAEQHFQESIEMMEEWLIQMAYREQKLSSVTLKEVFEDYPMDALQMMAEEKGLPELAKYPREELEDGLVAYMLQPEVMAEYIACMTDKEIEDFENWMISPKWQDAFLGVEKLLEGGYLGLLDEGSVSIPTDVLETYRVMKEQVMNTTEFQKKQKERSYLLCCLHVCNSFYGITPIRILMKLLETNPDIHMTEHEMRKQVAALPYELFQGDFAGDSFYSYNNYQDNGRLLRSQGKKEFYIPSQQEILSLGIIGYLPDSEEFEHLYHYLVEEMGVYQKTAYYLVPLIQNQICEGCSMQDLFLTLDKEGIRIKSEKQREELTRLLEAFWNNTRMREHRGYTPNEMMQKGNRHLELRQSDAANGSNIINFEQAKRKKVYPNEPCPCGSGKKFKNCCGKR